MEAAWPSREAFYQYCYCEESTVRLIEKLVQDGVAAERMQVPAGTGASTGAAPVPRLLPPGLDVRGRQADSYLIPGQTTPSRDEELWIIAKTPAEQQQPARDDTLPGTGALVAKVPDQATPVPVPLKHTDVKASIAGYIASVGFPFPLLLAWLAAFFELALALCLLTGAYFTEASVLAAAYVLFLTFAFHGPARWEGDRTEFRFFLIHFTFIAGL